MKWCCTECDWRGSDLLVSQNPFNRDDKIHGCPECKSVECFKAACDEPGCNKDASCGWPSADGYRNTCHDHWRINTEPHRAPNLGESPC
jgi:hypothetical protein